MNEICLRQYIQQVNVNYTSPEGGDKPSQIQTSHSNSWMEVGVVRIGPVTTDVVERNRKLYADLNQHDFLIRHDTLTKRLWFIWDPDQLMHKLAVDRCKAKKCGCIGGCSFFGNNLNGVRFFTNQQLDATDGVHKHYGSESLWGGRLDLGKNIKEHLMRRSGAISVSASDVKGTPDEKKRGKSFSSRMYNSGIGNLPFSTLLI